MTDTLISRRFVKITDSDARTFRITLTPELIDMGFDPTKNYPENALIVSLVEENKTKKIVIEKAEK